MEQRHPIIRKILTGVPPPLHQAGQREANDRWSSSSSPKTAHHGGGGSVRERAKAYEQRYTGSTGAAQAALEVSRIPVNDKRKHGQDAARPQSPYNAGKTSQGLRNGNGRSAQSLLWLFCSTLMELPDVTNIHLVALARETNKANIVRLPKLPSR